MDVAMNSNADVIYIPLVDEGTTVVRPTLGLPLGDGLYRVEATPSYDPDSEHWEFPPGGVVRCILEMRDGDQILVARELAAGKEYLG
jgi:hypothetical protein